MLQNIKLFSYRHIFWQLLKTDLATLYDQLHDKIINSMIWVSTVVAISAYLLPAFGLSPAYGAFLAAGSIVSSAGFEIFPQMVQFVSDLDGERNISYYLTLPIPSWLLLVKHICFYITNCMLISTVAIPTCKLVLLNRLDLSQLSIIRLIIAVFMINTLFGVLTLWFISYTKNVGGMGNTFMRIIYPLWFLGCFQFSWKVLYGFSPILAYINLLNPYVYAMELLRGVMLDPKDSLSFGLCILMLSVFIVLLSWHAIYRLKKRLDCI